MKPATVIKKYLEKDSIVGKVSVAEMMQFKKASSPEEFRQFAVDAAEHLEDVELDLD